MTTKAELMNAIKEFTVCKLSKHFSCDFTYEYKFHPIRKFRFDFCCIEKKLAIEVNGGVWIGGRHNRGSGYLKDLEKINLAASEGWRVLQFETKQWKTILESITTGAENENVNLIKKCLI